MKREGKRLKQMKKGLAGSKENQHGNHGEVRSFSPWSSRSIESLVRLNVPAKWSVGVVRQDRIAGCT